MISLLLYAFFGLFFLWPLYRILVRGFVTQGGEFTLQYVQVIFSDPQLVRGLINAVAIALIVTLVCLVIAIPLAILAVKFEFPFSGWLAGLTLAPLVLPPFVGAMGVRLLLGRLGPLSVLLGFGQGAGFDWLGRFRMLGMVMVEALHLYPILLLNVQNSLASVDPTMEQAAANLSANRWTVFRRITLPLIRPGIFAGCTLTLIWSFTELGTPLMFGFNTITPVQIFEQVTDVADNPLPFALVAVTLVVAVGLYLIGKVLLGREYDTSAGKATVAQTPKRLTGWKALAAAAPFLVVLGLALLPHISVVLTSISATGQWYRSILPREFTANHYLAALTNDLAMPSIVNSAIYAFAATAISVLVGLGVAIIAVRSRLVDRGVIEALAMVPLAVPGLVLAFGFLAISVSLKQKFGEKLPVWLDAQEMPVVFLVLAYAARRLPYMVRSTVAGLQQTPVDFELAAANLGASRSTVLRRITIPLILANLVAGALLVFTFSLLDVSDSIILAQKSAWFPITRAILELSQRLGDGYYIASALGVWMMLVLTATLLATNRLLGRKMGAVFRM